MKSRIWTGLKLDKLGIGFVGSGFSARFHLHGLVGVRGAEVVAVHSRSEASAREFAGLAERLGVGRPKVYPDLNSLLSDKNVNAVWVITPNDTHSTYVKEIAEEASQGRGNLRGVAVAKPLARNVREAREMLRAVERAGLLHGYLETEVFMPSFIKGRNVVWEMGAKNSGRPYLARAAEEHSGPHNWWFWRPSISGGGVTMDMACHSVESTRLMLLNPSKGKESLKPRSIYAEAASLKWTKPAYSSQLRQRFGVDFIAEPAEDYSLVTVSYEDEEGGLVLTESRSSWNFVGAGLRLSLEVLGPEYSLYVNTLQPESFIFLSRNVKVQASEAFVEKQNADQGLMPVIPDEPVTYGYQNADRHMVESFTRGVMPTENFNDGLLVTQLIMHAYMSAERGSKVRFNPTEVEDYVPKVAKGEWRPS